MATEISKDEAYAHLTNVFDRAMSGEEIVIAQSGKPRLRLLPVQEPDKQALPRVPGSMRGQFTVPDSFFDPLPEEELRAWEGG